MHIDECTMAIQDIKRVRLQKHHPRRTNSSLCLENKFLAGEVRNLIEIVWSDYARIYSLTASSVRNIDSNLHIEQALQSCMIRVTDIESIGLQKYAIQKNTKDNLRLSLIMSYIDME